jgi:hypothetical protein
VAADLRKVENTRKALVHERPCKQRPWTQKEVLRRLQVITLQHHPRLRLQGFLIRFEWPAVGHKVSSSVTIIRGGFGAINFMRCLCWRQYLVPKRSASAGGFSSDVLSRRVTPIIGMLRTRVSAVECDVSRLLAKGAVAAIFSKIPIKPFQIAAVGEH